MDPLLLLQKYYSYDRIAFDIIYKHSKAVADFALEIATKNNHLNLDLKFIFDAAMLHDIGIFKTNTPEIHCFGHHQYLEHGYLGRELLESEGWPMHALVCERHIGVGITKTEVINNKLPIPQREMIPVSHEEKIICLADKFFSKSGKFLEKLKPVSKIESALIKYGEHKLGAFNKLMNEYVVGKLDYK